MTDRELELCDRCGTHKEQPKHPCPYQCDINNNNDNWCYCCAECEQECANAI